MSIVENYKSRKVVFFLPPGCALSGHGNGVFQQCRVWKSGLMEMGVDAEIALPGSHINWRQVNWAIFLQNGFWLHGLVESVRRFGCKTAFAPIYDSNYSKSALIFGRMLLRRFGRFVTTTAVGVQVCRFADLVLVRSRHEMEGVILGYGARPGKVRIVNIGFDIPVARRVRKEPFCFHLSSIWQDRKNVIRLVEACELADVRLVLAGNSGGAEGEAVLERIRQSRNTEYQGFLDRDAIEDLMARAAVFALPSLSEGVGLAALEAASLGCEIVLTNRGGPKEYFRDEAFYVDPVSISSIADGIRRAMVGGFQPKLAQRIRNEFSPAASAEALLDVLKGKNASAPPC